MRKTLKEWLKYAEQKLSQAGIKTSRLDAELILARVLNTERTFIHINLDKKLSKTQIFHANNWLNKRAKRIPLAYIFGEKEFYGRNFKVNEHVLVPRPETENIIEVFKDIAPLSKAVLEIGTGSGIIAATIKLENPKIEVFASDISNEALSVAKTNANNLKSEIHFIKSNLLDNIPQKILESTDTILANLPYVSKDWIDSSIPNELNFEPAIALYAEQNGLEIIKKLISQTINLPNLKFLILEADPEQFNYIEIFANNFGFSKIKTIDYIIALKK